MLLEVVTCWRADGREISMREFPLERALSLGETVRAEEIVLGVPDGREVTVLLNATPILSAEGAVESVVVNMQDMAAVEELERLRAEFLAMVSHELRGPLISIKGSAATVLGSAVELDPAVIRQFFRIIDDQVDHLNHLVSDLLDVARIETGTLAVSPEPADPGVLLDRARSTFASAGGRSNLAIDIDPDLPRGMADRRRIVQVLTNLLSNAARNSPESSVIRVTAERKGVHVAVSVADEGRGIPAESLPHLFRKFSRVETGKHEGDTGLGLAICQDPSGPTEAGGVRTVEALHPGRPDHRLQRTHGKPGRSTRAAGGNGIQDALRTLNPRRAGGDLRPPIEPRLGRRRRRGHAAHAHHRKQTPPNARGTSRPPHLYLHRAPRRLPDAKERNTNHETLSKVLNVGGVAVPNRSQFRGDLGVTPVRRKSRY